MQGYTQNQIWCEIVAMASELLAWMAMLALDGPARRWEPDGSGSACSPSQARPRRPPPAAPPRRTMALEPAHHHRDQPPPEPSPRLTSRTRPDDQEGQETRAIGTPPTRRDNRETRHDPRLNRPPETARSRSLKPATHDHERCRLGSRHIFWRGRIIVKNAEPTVLQPACAMRRTVVSPAQRAEIERRCLWI